MRPTGEERKVGGSDLREEARQLAETSRREQGLDSYITDPVVLGKIAAVFAAPLSPPLRRDAARIKTISSPDRRADLDVLKDRREDRSLAA